MSLREETAQTLQWLVNIKGQDLSFEEQADILNRQILDAAESALLNCGEDANPLDILDAINKLRGE